MREWPVLRGVLPIERSRVPADVLAGLTLAAVGVPEVLGYARIAGMPLVTGLYTMLLPMTAFAVLGPSRAGCRPWRCPPSDCTRPAR